MARDVESMDSKDVIASLQGRGGVEHFDAEVVGRVSDEG